MRIQGLQKTTLLDYPGHVAATIFLGGCNFRCPFCHNMNIVDGCEDAITEEELLEFLKKRAGVLEGVCITGGEPTINEELPELVKKIKNIDSTKTLLVKLDTNGTNPQMIEYLIGEGLVDYIAMDIKSSEEEYHKAIGVDNKKDSLSIISSVKESIDIIINSDIDYEFRTTIVKQLHDKNAIKGIGQLIKGSRKHFIQSFKDSEYVEDHSFSAYDNDTLYQFADIMGQYVKEATVRGVD